MRSITLGHHTTHNTSADSRGGEKQHQNTRARLLGPLISLSNYVQIKECRILVFRCAGARS